MKKTTTSPVFGSTRHCHTEPVIEASKVFSCSREHEDSCFFWGGWGGASWETVWWFRSQREKHLQCIKPCKYWDEPAMNWCRMFFYQQYHGFIMLPGGLEIRFAWLIFFSWDQLLGADFWWKHLDARYIRVFLYRLFQTSIGNSELFRTCALLRSTPSTRVCRNLNDDPLWKGRRCFTCQPKSTSLQVAFRKIVLSEFHLHSLSHG